MKHKEAIEILTIEWKTSIHFSKYPQDRHKDDKQGIEVLITTSEFHTKRAVQLELSIKLLEDEN